MPVKFMGGNTEFDGFAPRESIRIKMNGGGMNFVHGGISLQEMVVPVIEYHYLRNDSMEYKRNKQKYDTKPVTVNLLSANRKISNMIFSLNFYQKDAVSTIVKLQSIRFILQMRMASRLVIFRRLLQIRPAITVQKELSVVSLI